MKLNRPTMDYIATLVRNKAQERINALEKEREEITKPYGAKHEAFINAMKDILSDATQALEKLVKKYKLEDRDVCWGWCTREVKARGYEDVRFSPTSEDQELINQIDQRIGEIRTEITEKYNEVIAKMTLGGDAADLEKLIAEIKF